MRSFELLAATLLLTSCASSVLPTCGAPAGDSGIERAALVRRVGIEDVERELMSATEAETLPPAPRKALGQWVKDNMQQLLVGTQPGDEVWFYRFEKCCGWYREGYVVLRGQCVLAELTTREDM